MPSKHKHITWRETKYQKGWIVQYKGRTWGGFHTTLKQAKKVLYKAMQKHNGQIPCSKKRRNGKGDYLTYYGISYHKGIKKYVGHTISLGQTYTKPKDAFQKLCAVLKTPRKKMPRPYRRKLSPTKLLQRLKCLIKWGESGQQKWLPDDLMSTYVHCSKSQQMYNDEPALECSSLSMKYLPWKDALYAAWKQEKSNFPSPKKRTFADRAQLVKQVMVHAARTIAIKPVPNAWPLNCNRSRHREQGPVIFLRNMGIIKKKTVNNASRVSFAEPDPAKTTKKRNFWFLRNNPPDNKIREYIAAFDAIVKAVGSPPTTIVEWSTKMKDAMDGPEGPHLSGRYMKAWHIRSYMLSCMYRSKIGSLKIEDAPLNAFVNMNPDACGNLKRLRSHFEVSKRLRSVTTEQYLQWGHSICPELFSMWCCLAMDKGFRDADFRQFNNTKWQTAARTYYATTKVYPHPAVPS